MNTAFLTIRKKEIFIALSSASNRKIAIQLWLMETDSLAASTTATIIIAVGLLVGSTKNRWYLYRRIEQFLLFLQNFFPLDSDHHDPAPTILPGSEFSGHRDFQCVSDFALYLVSNSCGILDIHFVQGESWIGIRNNDNHKSGTFCRFKSSSWIPVLHIVRRT